MGVFELVGGQVQGEGVKEGEIGQTGLEELVLVGQFAYFVAGHIDYYGYWEVVLNDFLDYFFVEDGFEGGFVENVEVKLGFFVGVLYLVQVGCQTRHVYLVYQF